MQRTKLIRLLKTLDETEFEKFCEFVGTPYFNTNGSVTKLLAFIRQYFPDFDQETLNDATAFNHIFPRDKYIPKKRVVTKLSSKLLSLLAEYLSIERHRSSSFEKKFNLLLHFRDHHMMDDFHALAKKTKNNHKEKTSPNAYYENFLIEREINRMVSRMVDKGIGDVNFQDASEALDEYFIYIKLIYTCQKLNRSQVIMGVDISDNLTQMLDTIPSMPYYNAPQIKIWHQAYRLLSTKNQEERKTLYQDLKQELFGEQIPLEIDQMRLLFTYLENTAIRKLESDNVYDELYDLYHFQDERKILLNDKTAVPHLIKNYVSVLLNKNLHEEAIQFLESNKDSILPHFEQHYQICRALIAFEQKDYESSLDILNTITLHNIYLKINEKRLRIKIYHHLEYNELIQDSINSFRVFLTNNKSHIHQHHLESNRNFINLYHKISKSIFDGTMLSEIDSYDKIADKKWLNSILHNTLQTN